MRDIKTREDIQLMVHSFYGLALKDNVLGPVFAAAEINLESHLPTIVSFWESILLDNPVYRGNPMLIHLNMHRKYPLDQGMFNRWLDLWKQTVHHHFAGRRAQLATNRAESIAKLMLFKIGQMD